MRNIIFVIFISFISVLYSQNGDKKFTVSDIYSGSKFSSRLTRGIQWYQNGAAYTYLETDEISKLTNLMKYDIRKKTAELFVSGNDLKQSPEDKPLRIMNYSFSPDERFILFTGIVPARYLKSGGSIYLYEIKNKKFFEIDTKQPTMNVKFSPDSKNIGYVKGHNIYIFNIEMMSEKQLTFDGNENILNGHFDWVYEEEFGINDGWQFSADSKEIAYWQLDQSLVPAIEIQQFDSLYFNSIKMRYPKAGGTNSNVGINCINIETGKITKMDIGQETDIYIPRIKWTENSNTLAIQRMNRLQTRLELLLANSKTGNSKIILKEEDTTWVDIEKQNLFFLRDQKEFVITSEKDGFRHLYLYDMNGKLKKQITKGNWQIDNWVKLNEKDGEVFFTSGMGNPLVSLLYKLEIKSGKLDLLTPGTGSNIINISPDYKHFIRTYHDVNNPPKQILMSTDGQEVKEISSNSKFLNLLEEYKFSRPDFICFPTTDGVKLNGMIIKPKDFSSGKKYPVLIYNYSGPGSQVVKDAWGGGQYLWYQMLAQEGYIVFMLDGRGTGGREKDFERIVYKNLGFWEVNDQIEAVKYLSSLDYIDQSRIGIWGWSYGGYVAAKTIMDAADYFKVSIAVAPVTDWDFYDSIYSERFMSLPSLNPQGYEASSVLNKTKNLKGKFLLIHGTADDNVHFQNSVRLTEELIKSNKQFNVMFYPGKDHGIAGGNTREQLFTMITNFVLNNL